MTETAEAMTINVKAITNRDTVGTLKKGGIVILATLKMVVQPDRRVDLLKTMMGMLEPARVEKGCLSYRLYEDIENRDAFLLMEEWAAQEDVERHISKESQRRLLALMDLLIEEPELRFYTVSRTVGMELIADVLKTPG